MGKDEDKKKDAKIIIGATLGISLIVLGLEVVLVYQMYKYAKTGKAGATPQNHPIIFALFGATIVATIAGNVISIPINAMLK